VITIENNARHISAEEIPMKPFFEQLKRIADSLEKMVPVDEPFTLDPKINAYVWSADTGALSPIKKVNRLQIDLLKGIERPMSTLIENTRRFSQGLPANNALLWGARGTGKSSLVKAVHGYLEEKYPNLTIVEIHREDISSLSKLLQILKNLTQRRFILFCDDLSFDSADENYKSLKTLLEGGIEGRPDNVIFYATSNRRHLMARQMIENERTTAISGAETVEEKVSLSDRFGLWLGFHNCDQKTFLDIIDAYAERFEIQLEKEELHSAAIEWSVTRGARSGRVAWQFIQDVAGKQGKTLLS
jgi:predicted AAA+ superfamily ATPase